MRRGKTRTLDGYVHELHAIATAVLTELQGLGLLKIEESWDDNAFGSGLVILGRSAPELRVIWDGKDGWAYLQALDTSSSSWKDIAGPITEGDFAAGKPDGEKMGAMIEAGRRSLA
jgi:hypothetical protein